MISPTDAAPQFLKKLEIYSTGVTRGSIPGLCVICGLSLLLFLFSAPRGFSPGTPVFPSPQKLTLLNSSWPFLSSPLSLFQSESKCEVFVMIISSNLNMNELIFIKKDFALSLALKWRLRWTRKWPIWSGMLGRLINEPLAREIGQPLLTFLNLNKLNWFDFDLIFAAVVTLLINDAKTKEERDTTVAVLGKGSSFGVKALILFFYTMDRAVFKWMSELITWSRSLRLVTGLQISRQFFNQWEAKPKPLAPCTRDFSRVLSKLYVTARNSNWLIVMFALVSWYWCKAMLQLYPDS